MKFAALITAILASFAASAFEYRLDCPDPGGWTIETAESATGAVEVLTLRLSSPTSAVPPRFSVVFDMPQIDAHHKWGPWFEKATLPPDWGGGFRSRLCRWLPLSAYLNGGDRSRICVAVSEARRNVTIDSGLREEDCRIVWKVGFFSEPEAPISGYEVSIRVDRRDVFFGDAIREGTAWIERTAGLKPAESPPAAFEPLYSSWYAFHQDVFDRDLEAESAAERIVGVYAPDTAVPFPGAGKAQFVLNGTGTGRLIVEAATPAVAEVRDTFGNFVGSVPLVRGLNDVRVPVSGYLAIREPGDGASGLQDTGMIKKERYLVPGQNARSLPGKGERISASLSTIAIFCSG